MRANWACEGCRARRCGRGIKPHAVVPSPPHQPGDSPGRLDMVVACEDCVEVHGDKPEEWLAKWPAGAEWWAAHAAWLCDGCFDNREDQSDPMDDFNYVGSKWHY